MDPDRIVQEWHTHGFVILSAHLRPEWLTPAVEQLGTMFPSADGFHDRTDPRWSRFDGDEWAGIDSFPFSAVEVSLLAVSDPVLRLAELLLGGPDLRMYSAEAWAKFTGAADYDQPLHRDYLNHTLVVPTRARGYRQLELFVYLVDVPEELGPPHLLSRTYTEDVPARPNWFPGADVDSSDDDFDSPIGRPDLYAEETSGAGPAGTVVAFEPGTFHRGTALRAPRGARYSMHLSFRPAEVEWGQRAAWADRSHGPAWYDFVSRASPRQLELFGFPPPGHPYWTPETLDGVALRYRGLDLTPWR
jgi:hypothetical protein